MRHPSQTSRPPNHRAISHIHLAPTGQRKLHARPSTHLQLSVRPTTSPGRSARPRADRPGDQPGIPIPRSEAERDTLDPPDPRRGDVRLRAGGDTPRPVQTIAPLNLMRFTRASTNISLADWRVTVPANMPAPTPARPPANYAHSPQTSTRAALTLTAKQPAVPGQRTAYADWLGCNTLRTDHLMRPPDRSGTNEAQTIPPINLMRFTRASTNICLRDIYPAQRSGTPAGSSEAATPSRPCHATAQTDAAHQGLDLSAHPLARCASSALPIVFASPFGKQRRTGLHAGTRRDAAPTLQPAAPVLGQAQLPCDARSRNRDERLTVQRR